MAHRINFNDYLYLQGHNVHITGTEGLRVPIGNSSQRPLVMAGIVRYNEEEDQFELGTGNDVLILNNRNEGSLWYSKNGGDLDGTLVIKDHRILNNTGTINEPSYSFYDHPNTGIFSPSSDNISFIIESNQNTMPIVEMVRNDNTDLGQTMTIHGNLVVEGDQSVFNTQVLEVEDNRITLNKNGNTSGTSGIDIEGNGSIQATFHYDYSVSKWSLNNSIITNSNQPVDDSDLTNKIYVDTQVSNVQQNLTNHENANEPHSQYLRRDDNLSTVNSVQLSRDNLNVYSQDEVDQIVSGSVNGALYQSDLQQNGGTIPETDRINVWNQPQEFGNYHIGIGNNTSNGLSIRSTTDPSNGENIFSIESSGTNTHFGVTNNFGTWIKDGLRIGNQYNSSMTDADSGVVIGAPTGDTFGSGSINAELIYRNGEELDSRYYTQTEINTQITNLDNTLSSDISDVDTKADNIQQELTNHKNATDPHTQYARNDENLSQLFDISAARTNIDVYSTTEVDNLNATTQQNLTDHINDDTAHTQYLRKDNALSGLMDIPGSRTTLDVYSTGETDTLLNDKIDVSEKASANGVATLDSNTKIPTNQLPALAITSTFSVADITERDDLVTNNDVQEGDVAIVTDDGNGLTRSYILDSTDTWQEINTPGDVHSVNGYTGSVSLDYTDVNADQQGTAQSIMDTHEAATDPHSQYLRKDNTLNGLADIPGSRTTLDVYSTTEVDNINSTTQQNLTDHINDDTAHSQYLRKDNALSGLTDIPGARTTLDVYSTNETDTLLNDKIDVSEKASANGVATLDSNTKVPANQLPALAITNTFSVADIPERDSLVTNNEVQEGDVAIVADDGNGLTRSYILDSTDTWKEINSPGDVYSVNGYTEHVSLDYTDVNADQQGTAQSIMDTHEAGIDPHSQYLRKDNTLSGLTDISGSRTTLDVYSTTEVDNINSTTQQNLTDHINDDTAHNQYLRKDNTLSGLTDIPGARTTLDVYSTTEVDTEITNAVSTALFDSDLEQNGGTIQENNINSTVSGNRIFKGNIVSANSQGKITLNPNNDGSVGIWSTRVDSSGNFVWREENVNNIDHGYIATDGGFVIGSPTGTTQGSGSVNAETIYRNGVELDSRYYTQTQINEKKANEYTEQISLASGSTHTITASSLPFTVSELRSITVDLKVLDTEAGSTTENMWIDGTATLTYGIDTTNNEIVVVNEFNQTLDVFIRIIM